jgi:hypothetical protein
MARMHCPICQTINYVGGGVQILCWKCGNFSHMDNWTFAKPPLWVRILDWLDDLFD